MHRMSRKLSKPRYIKDPMFKNTEHYDAADKNMVKNSFSVFQAKARSHCSMFCLEALWKSYDRYS